MANKQRLSVGLREPLHIRGLDVPVVPSVAFKGYSPVRIREHVQERTPTAMKYVPNGTVPVVLTDSQIYHTSESTKAASEYHREYEGANWDRLLDDNTHLTEIHGEEPVVEAAERLGSILHSRHWILGGTMVPKSTLGASEGVAALSRNPIEVIEYFPEIGLERREDATTEPIELTMPDAQFDQPRREQRFVDWHGSSMTRKELRQSGRFADNWDDYDTRMPKSSINKTWSKALGVPKNVGHSTLMPTPFDEEHGATYRDPLAIHWGCMGLIPGFYTTETVHQKGGGRIPLLGAISKED